jgi:hypothetical protein
VTGNFIHTGLPIYSDECTFYGCNAPGDVLEFPEPEVIRELYYTVTYVDEEVDLVLFVDLSSSEELIL